VTSYAGGYAPYLEARAERQAHAKRSESNRQNFLRKELEWLRRQPKARRTKQKAPTARANEAIGQSARKVERHPQP
jgi:ATP-binding cassette subfamily F protein uup